MRNYKISDYNYFWEYLQDLNHRLVYWYTLTGQLMMRKCQRVKIMWLIQRKSLKSTLMKGSDTFYYVKVYRIVMEVSDDSDEFSQSITFYVRHFVIFHSQITVT